MKVFIIKTAAGFKRFEEIKARQKAHNATKKIYEITSKNSFSKRFTEIYQLLDEVGKIDDGFDETS